MIHSALSRLIQRAPEIPGRDGAMRAPLLAVLHQLFRRGKFPFAKSFGEAFLHSVIVDWPNIRTAKVKQQKHLHSPPAYAAHLRKTRDVSHPVWQEFLPGRAILFLDKAREPVPRLLRRPSRLVAGKRWIPPAHRT